MKRIFRKLRAAYKRICGVARAAEVTRLNFRLSFCACGVEQHAEAMRDDLVGLVGQQIVFPRRLQKPVADHGEGAVFAMLRRRAASPR